MPLLRLLLLLLQLLQLLPPPGPTMARMMTKLPLRAARRPEDRWCSGTRGCVRRFFVDSRPFSFLDLLALNSPSLRNQRNQQELKAQKEASKRLGKKKKDEAAAAEAALAAKHEAELKSLEEGEGGDAASAPAAASNGAAAASDADGASDSLSRFKLSGGDEKEKELPNLRKGSKAARRRAERLAADAEREAERLRGENDRLRRRLAAVLNGDSESEGEGDDDGGGGSRAGRGGEEEGAAAIKGGNDESSSRRPRVWAYISGA